MKAPRLPKLAAVALCFAAALAGPALAADPSTINCDGVPSTTLTLFYPAQSTYQ